MLLGKNVTEHLCVICQDEMRPGDLVARNTGCSHWFHKACIGKHIKAFATFYVPAQCPVCRADTFSLSLRICSTHRLVSLRDLCRIAKEHCCDLHESLADSLCKPVVPTASHIW